VIEFIYKLIMRSISYYMFRLVSKSDY